MRSCARERGLLTRENPNLLKPRPGSEPRLSVSDIECCESESEKPGGGASCGGGAPSDPGAGHTLGRLGHGSDGGGGGTPLYTWTSFRPCRKNSLTV